LSEDGMNIVFLLLPPKAGSYFGCVSVCLFERSPVHKISQKDYDGIFAGAVRLDRSQSGGRIFRSHICLLLLRFT